MQRWRLLLVFVLIGLCGACATSRQVRAPKEKGTIVVASWYGEYFRGRKTANGERFNPDKISCAHKTLPFGTILKVTNIENDKSLVVRVNDRGPYIRGRSLDLSRAAAQRLGFMRKGTTKLRMEIVEEKQG